MDNYATFSLPLDPLSLMKITFISSAYVSRITVYFTNLRRRSFDLPYSDIIVGKTVGILQLIRTILLICIGRIFNVKLSHASALTLWNKFACM